MVEAVQVTDRCTFHGEGPFWDDRVGRLLFVDMLAGVVVDWDPSGEIVRHAVGTLVAVVRARARGGYIVALERGFAFASQDFDVVEPLPPVFASETLRMNEGGCDPQGRFYCGSMAYDATPGAGTLYRLDPNLSVGEVLKDITISNGLQWSADGQSVYFADTATGCVDVFEFDGDAGELRDRRTLIRIDPSRGAPDGMAIDEEGGLWIALWGGSAVHRYEPNGSLSEVITLPVSRVTACTFGGRDRRTLFVTTSRLGLTPPVSEQAGALFAAEVGVRGATLNAFGG